VERKKYQILHSKNMIRRMINELKEETHKLVSELKELGEFKQMNEIKKTMQDMKWESNKGTENLKNNKSEMNSLISQ
jgi:sugar-specific transcriptional regulator TrmB